MSTFGRMGMAWVKAGRGRGSGSGSGGDGNDGNVG